MEGKQTVASITPSVIRGGNNVILFNLHVWLQEVKKFPKLSKQWSYDSNPGLGDSKVHAFPSKLQVVKCRVNPSSLILQCSVRPCVPFHSPVSSPDSVGCHDAQGLKQIEFFCWCFVGLPITTSFQRIIKSSIPRTLQKTAFGQRLWTLSFSSGCIFASQL